MSKKMGNMNKVSYYYLIICCVLSISICCIVVPPFSKASLNMKSYKLTASYGDHGKIKPATRTVREGAKAAFKIKPSADYLIDTITVDGLNIDLSAAKDLSKPNIYTFDNVITSHTISATFKQIPKYQKLRQ